MKFTLRSIVTPVFFTLLFLLVISFILTSKKAKITVSDNILYLTQPVTTFSGKIEKIEGNTIFVSQTFTLPKTNQPQAISASLNQSPIPLPTPQTKTITFKVVITKDTQIAHPSPSIPYLFKSSSPLLPSPLAVKDLKVGELVTVLTTKDLRTLQGDTIEATSIILPLFSNTVSGRIITIQGNTFTLRVVFPSAAITQPPKETLYTITITSDTEISRYDQSNKPERLTLSDLNPDMDVTVYTDSDVTTETQLRALRIEPQITGKERKTP